jgi:hypothetical protein
VEGLTTNLLLDDRQLPGWGHVPLGGAAASRPSLGATGGLNHTGRGSVGSNVLTMPSVSVLYTPMHARMHVHACMHVRMLSIRCSK